MPIAPLGARPGDRAAFRASLHLLLTAVPLYRHSERLLPDPDTGLIHGSRMRRMLSRSAMAEGASRRSPPPSSGPRLESLRPSSASRRPANVTAQQRPDSDHPQASRPARQRLATRFAASDQTEVGPPSSTLSLRGARPEPSANTVSRTHTGLPRGRTPIRPRSPPGCRAWSQAQRAAALATDYDLSRSVSLPMSRSIATHPPAASASTPATIDTRSMTRLASYIVLDHLPPPTRLGDPRGRSKAQESLRLACPSIYCRPFARLGTDATVGGSRRCTSGRRRCRSSPRQFPQHHLVISHPAPRWGARDTLSGRRMPASWVETGIAGQHRHHFHGAALASRRRSQRAVPDPLRHRHGLHRARAVLKSSSPSHHPVDPVVGRHRALLALMWACDDLTIIAIIASSC